MTSAIVLYPPPPVDPGAHRLARSLTLPPCGRADPGADTRDASGQFRTAYPAASFRKILARAFVASRTIDALVDRQSWPAAVAALLPSLDTARVCITGHSRNGKQSVIAAVRTCA